MLSPSFNGMKCVDLMREVKMNDQEEEEDEEEKEEEEVDEEDEEDKEFPLKMYFSPPPSCASTFVGKEGKSGNNSFVVIQQQTSLDH